MQAWTDCLIEWKVLVSFSLAYKHTMLAVPQLGFGSLSLTAAAEITESIKCSEKHWLENKLKKKVSLQCLK